MIDNYESEALTNSLKGKLVSSVEWDENNIKILHRLGPVITLNAYGDCCSQSFIEDLDNPDAFNDATIESVEVVRYETKDVGSPGDYGNTVHKWTFYKFKTDKGMCTVSFRNESNGYYNGDLRIVE